MGSVGEIFGQINHILLDTLNHIDDLLAEGRPELARAYIAGIKESSVFVTCE